MLDRLSESHRSFVCVSVLTDGGQCSLCIEFAEGVGRSLL